MEFRKPTADEKRLLVGLAGLAGLKDPSGWANSLMVRGIGDGEMGSLEIDGGQNDAESGVVRSMASVQFSDEDGVSVIATLNSGESGTPFELDIWKTDFSPLVRIPEVFDSCE